MKSKILLVETFHQIYMIQNLCVDGQMVPFKGDSSMKQYIPSKPCKYGYNVFVLVDSKVMSYEFMMYTVKIVTENVPQVPRMSKF